MEPMFEILLVDDNPTEVALMEEALTSSRLTNRLHAVQDGVEAMAFLRHEGPYKGSPRPGLILLDLNMPRKGGLQTLSEIKADPDLRGIPTVMLTSSNQQSEIDRAYGLQANGFVQKPIDLDDYVAIMGGIEQYWTGVVRLPA
ncbi:MAG: response regulator [bacterium]